MGSPGKTSPAKCRFAFPSWAVDGGHLCCWSCPNRLDHRKLQAYTQRQLAHAPQAGALRRGQFCAVVKEFRCLSRELRLQKSLHARGEIRPRASPPRITLAFEIEWR